ncbi:MULTISPECIES: ParB/RepB/Spo0J family partition protein [Agrobacterium]|uniref:Chromosome partitioning protein ParB n=1 Tax=Agrobacterium fabrum TaxID=1176649 RepID=A0A2W5EVK7_9HYPH|nr:MULTISPECIES: ParB/RepB/Spo0J family partition protein [Agrobacterium]PZP45974.1 MAG: chromosome partitioning protein ParB [Agrobacterium fabrum]QCL76077.1 chromosome partitioning protein ParB [Agrobacterium tumefaciens]CUX69228.1 ParB domain-containing protein nuclease [Agrobacterium sp. NCPPB 925]
MPKPQNVAKIDVRTKEVRDIPLSEIDIPENRARSFDPDEAKALAFVIASSGLQHPIRVRAVGNRFRLVAGRKRLEAIRLLEWEAIPSTVSNAETDDDARLEEVMENLGRYDLNKLDRCQHLYELKQVYERLHPESKNGGDRKSEIRTQNLRSDAENPEIFGFAATMAEKIGMSRRSIELAVEIWTGLTPESRQRLAGTRLANHQSGLKELSEQSPAAQAGVLDLLLSDTPAASTVSEAVTIFRKGTAMTPAEKKLETVKRTLNSLPAPVADAAVSAQVDARIAEMKKNIAILSKFFADLKDDDLDSVIDQNEDRVIASLKRRGRIQ